MDAFANNKVGGFTHAIMVCPLHEKLPCLILSVTCTCGGFYLGWIKNQWIWIDTLWNSKILQIVGPIIRYAINGNNYRWQVMLKDYLHVSGARFSIPWLGWLLSASNDFNP
jgi:hypothetical protein